MRAGRGRPEGTCSVAVRFIKERQTLYSRLRKECKLKGKVHWPVRRMFQEEKGTTIGYKVL